MTGFWSRLFRQRIPDEPPQADLDLRQKLTSLDDTNAGRIKRLEDLVDAAQRKRKNGELEVPS